MSNEPHRCPSCQAELTNVAQCWLCRHRLTAAEQARQSEPPIMAELAANPYQPPPTIGDTVPADCFILVLLVGLILVFGVLVSIAPGFGILMAVFTAPALIRTAVVILRKRGQGKVLSGGEKSLLFLASIAAVVTAGVAATTAFAITCVASCFGLMVWQAKTRGNMDQALMAMLAVSVVVGLLTGGIVLLLLWRRKHADAA